MAGFLIYFLLGVLAVYLLDRALRRFSRTPVEEVKKKGLWAASIGLALASVVSPLARRLVMLAALVLPGLLGRARVAGQPSGGTAGRGGGAGPMSRTQALEVLGLAEPASREMIEEAYRRLMRQYHPDQGGSEYFAKQLNAARDALLQGKP